METNGLKILRVVNIYYYPGENRFKTETGQTIYNMQPLVSPNMVFLFRHNRQSMSYVIQKYGLRINLFYPKEVS